MKTDRNTADIETPGPRFRPSVSSYEWYAKWALHTYKPCGDCSHRYKAEYGRLQGIVEAAEACFEAAYQVYGELAHMSGEEVPRHEYLSRKRQDSDEIIIS